MHSTSFHIESIKIKQTSQQKEKCKDKKSAS